MSKIGKNNNKKSILTSRQKSIVETLTKFNEIHPITISAISEKLGISSRTVVREIPFIESWLLKNNFKLVKKPGIGIFISGQTDNIHTILEKLETETIKIKFSKNEKRDFIIGELLLSEFPLKYFYFTSALKISEKTLISDIEWIEKFLSVYGISIIRKPGFGIKLNGSEKSYRQAMSNLLYKYTQENQNFDFLFENLIWKDSKMQTEFGNFKLLEFTNQDILKNIEDILIENFNKNKITYTDNAIKELLIHFYVNIIRLTKSNIVKIKSDKFNSLSTLPEYKLAEEISKALSDRFKMVIPKDETTFIAINLIGSKIVLNQTSEFNDIKNINVRKITIDMISIVENFIKIKLRDNEILKEDLYNHINNTIDRLSMDIKINDFVSNDVKKNYSDIFEATEKACELLKPICSVEKIPKAEISFIAVHFCAAVEKIRSSKNKLHVALVCPSGIGTSKMLAVNLMNQFSNIEVVTFFPISKIDEQKLKKENIDLIISTVDIKTNYPFVCVHPTLLEQDKIILKNTFKNLKEKQNKDLVFNKSQISVKDINFISKLGNEIESLLKNIKLQILDHISDKNTLIEHASKLFSKNETEQQNIFNELLKREEICPTYIKEFQMMLFHCKIKTITNCLFGYIRLLNPLIDNENEVTGSIIMIIPDTENNIFNEIMSEISGSIIENENLFLAIKEGNRGDIVKESEKSLCKYYKKIILKRLES